MEQSTRSVLDWDKVHRELPSSTASGASMEQSTGVPVSGALGRDRAHEERSTGVPASGALGRDNCVDLKMLICRKVIPPPLASEPPGDSKSQAKAH